MVKRNSTKVATIIIMSIIFSIVLVALVNVGTSLFLKEPVWDNSCNPKYETYIIEEPDDSCAIKYEAEQQAYNQTRFFILAGLGFLLIIGGIFIPEPISKFTGMGSGGIMVVEAVMFNLDNKLIVFITLALFLAIGILATIRLLRRK